MCHKGSGGCNYDLYFEILVIKHLGETRSYKEAKKYSVSKDKHLKFRTTETRN
jgi:hypothetical protein